MQSDGKGQLFSTHEVLPSEDLSRVQWLSIPWKLEGLEYSATFWNTLAYFKGLKEVSVVKTLGKDGEKHKWEYSMAVEGGSCFPSNDALAVPRRVADIEHHYFCCMVLVYTRISYIGRTKYRIAVF